MRIHLVASAIDGVRVQWYQAAMFHGQCALDEFSYLCLPYEEKARVSHPLKLICNGWRIPEFFMPGSRVVIRSQIKHALEATYCFAFRPVEFVKLIELPYQAGDSSYRLRYPEYFQRYVGVFNPDKLFETLPDVPPLHQTAGTYFELILPTIYELAKNQADRTTMTTLTVPFLPYCSEEHSISLEMVHAHPIIDAGYLIFSDPAFAAVSPFVDWDYFEKVEVEL